MIQVVDVTLNRGEIPKFAVREYIRYICDCQWRFGKFRLIFRVSCLFVFNHTSKLLYRGGTPFSNAENAACYHC